MKRFEYIGGVNVRYNVSQSTLLTFRAGGNVAAVLSVSTSNALQRVLRLCEEQRMHYYLLGKGANTLPTANYDGVVVKYEANSVWVEGNMLYAQSGASGAKVAHLAQTHSLGGVQALAVIPCTIGGAVCCNAGCYGQSTQDVFAYAVATNGYDTRVFTAQQAQFGYHTSAFSSNGYAIFQVALKLRKQSIADIKQVTEQFRLAKFATQPLSYPSAGSVFARSGDIIPAQLIDQAGLKGTTFGGAHLSHKHANFIVNVGNATAEDITALIEYITGKIKEKYSLTLTREPKYLGEK